MDKTVIVILIVYLIISGIAVIGGLDLRKWHSWLYGIFGFVSGFFIFFSMGDLHSGLIGATLSAFIIIYGGAMTRLHKQRYK